jgi:hypothetical protein
VVAHEAAQRLTERPCGHAGAEFLAGVVQALTEPSGVRHPFQSTDAFDVPHDEATAAESAKFVGSEAGDRCTCVHANNDGPASSTEAGPSG